MIKVLVEYIFILIKVLFGCISILIKVLMEYIFIKIKVLENDVPSILGRKYGRTGFGPICRIWLMAAHRWAG